MGCGVCGDPGHNRRTHSQHAPVQGEALIDQPGPVDPVAPSGADRAREALKGARQGQFAVPPNQPHDGGGNLFATGLLRAELEREARASIELDRDQTHDVGPVTVGEPFTVSMDVDYNLAGLEQFMVGRTSSVVPDEEDQPEPWGDYLANGAQMAGDRASFQGEKPDTPTGIRSCARSEYVTGAPDEEDQPVCACKPCESPAFGVPGIDHCAACCAGSGIEEYNHDCPFPAHREMAVQRFGERPDRDGTEPVGAEPYELVDGPFYDLPTAPWRTVLGPDEPIRITLPGVYELTAEQYHDIAVTGDWFSNSDGKALLESCPAQFDYNRRNKIRKTSDAYDFGHVWHALVLGKGELYRVFEPKKLDGRTKDGKAQAAEVALCRAGGVTPIYGDQFRLIEAMAEAVKADPVAYGLMSAPGRQEVCLFWREQIKVTDPHNKLYGQVVTVQRRAMIDHLPDMPAEGETVTLVDGKTADDVKPDDNMRKKIYDYAYHRQADTYAAGVEALFNVVAEVVFLFQSKKPPHLIVPVDLDTPAMRVAAAQNRQALEQWAECVATGEWPGYTKGIATSGVPAWIERAYDEEIGEF